jgi:hypothetical protein
MNPIVLALAATMTASASPPATHAPAEVDTPAGVDLHELWRLDTGG